LFLLSLGSYGGKKFGKFVGRGFFSNLKEEVEKIGLGLSLLVLLLFTKISTRRE